MLFFFFSLSFLACKDLTVFLISHQGRFAGKEGPDFACRYLKAVGITIALFLNFFIYIYKLIFKDFFFLC